MSESPRQSDSELVFFSSFLTDFVLALYGLVYMYIHTCRCRCTNVCSVSLLTQFSSTLSGWTDGWTDGRMATTVC